MTKFFEAINDDTGTLCVGDVVVELGDVIRVEGEAKRRRVTNVFGAAPRTHAACAGSGAFPTGPVRWELLPRGSAADDDAAQPAPLPKGPKASPGAGAVSPRTLTCELFAGAGTWRPAAALHVVGFDSAWTRSKVGALAAIRADGAGLSLAVPPCACGFARALAVVAELRARGPVLLAIDQPLVVPNATSCRPVDRAAGSLVNRRGGGVQPANTSKAEMFGAGAPIWEFLREVAPTSIDPAARPTAPTGLWALEVFPALASIGLFPEVERGRALKYNPAVRRTFRPDDWAGLGLALVAIAADLRIPALAAWATRLATAAPKKALQDEVDAVLCALIGLLIQFAPTTTATLGDARAGYIVTVCPPTLRAEMSIAAAQADVPFTPG